MIIWIYLVCVVVILTVIIGGVRIYVGACKREEKEIEQRKKEGKIL